MKQICDGVTAQKGTATGEIVRLPDDVLSKIKKAGVEVWFANRSVTSVWNGDRDDGEPVKYGGWYWHQVVKGRVISHDDEGPFRSRSAALRDAYMKLQLKHPPWGRGTSS